MALDIIASDLFVAGTLTANAMTISASAVTDTSVLAAANVAASKLEHQHEPAYAQVSTATGFVERRVLHVVKGATASVYDFRVGAVTAAIGAATMTIDLKKNGTTILTASISLDSTTAAFAVKQPAGYTSTALVAGDVLEVDVTAATAGGGTIAKGFFAQLVIREKA